MTVVNPAPGGGNSSALSFLVSDYGMTVSPQGLTASAGQSAVGDIFNWFVSRVLGHSGDAGARSHAELTAQAAAIAPPVAARTVCATCEAEIAFEVALARSTNSRCRL